MIDSCPHCMQQLRIGASHKEKIQKAIAGLQPGKRLTIKCPHCKQGISLENTNGNGQSLDGSDQPRAGSGLQPPSPPDLDWLRDESFVDEGAEEDVPMALVLYPESNDRERVVEALETVGYRVICDSTTAEALDRMSFINFACVILHSNFENKGLEESTFHEHLCGMIIQQRRYIFYILIGQEFHTLYNMEALSKSANLVVNENDLKYLDVILRQSIPAHETLFGNIMEEMAAYGKK